MVTKKIPGDQGTLGFESRAYWTAARCSITELYPPMMRMSTCNKIVTCLQNNWNKGDKEKTWCSGDTQVWIRDLLDSSQLLYHWAISPCDTKFVHVIKQYLAYKAIETKGDKENSLWSGDTWISTKGLLDRSQLLYHWAISHCRHSLNSTLSTK